MGTFFRSEKQDIVRFKIQSGLDVRPGVGKLFDSWPTIVLKFNRVAGQKQIDEALV